MKPPDMCQCNDAALVHRPQPSPVFAAGKHVLGDHAAVLCADFLFPESVAYASGNLQEGTITPRCTTEDSRQVGCPSHVAPFPQRVSTLQFRIITQAEPIVLDKQLAQRIKAPHLLA